MPKTTNSKSRRKVPVTPRAPAGDNSIERRIAEKAYELYRQRGCADGRDLDDWLEAERILTGRARLGEAVRAVEPRRAGQPRVAAPRTTRSRRSTGPTPERSR